MNPPVPAHSADRLGPSSQARGAGFRRRSLLAAALGACFIGMAIAPVPPGPARAVAASRTEVEGAVQVLRQADQSIEARRAAVVRLLDHDSSQATAALVTVLASPGDLVVQQLVAQSIASSASSPPTALVPALISLMDRADDTLLADLARALARYDDSRTRRRIESLAGDSRASTRQRRGAIWALAQDRSQDSAQVLMSLLAPGQPPVIQHAAMAGLAQLTGMQDADPNPEQWRQWWAQASQMSESQWIDHLFAHFSRNQSLLVQQAAQTQERLVQLQRRLFRATPEADQQAALVEMLQDPLEAVRRVGMDEAQNRLRAQGVAGFGAELRESLRGRLADAVPWMRQQAAGLLRDLADPEGASRVAQLLAENKESRPELLQMYLRLLARLPRVPAIEPAITLMADPALAGEAAAAVAAAIDARLLNPEQLQRAALIARQEIQKTKAPEPKLIAVLGRAGIEQDWVRIESLLDSEATVVRDAAAAAWALSDRPLLVLARRAGDPVILPSLLEAVTRRGDDPRVLLELVRHRPAQGPLLEAWRRALTDMAHRTDPGAVVEADQQLAGTDEPASFRAGLLTAGIEALAPAGKPAPGLDAASQSVLADLLLRRARLRESDDPRQALLDYQAPAAMGLQLDAPRRLALDTGVVRSRLVVNDLDGLGEQLAALVAGPETADGVPRRDLAGAVLDAVDRAIEGGRKDDARRLMGWVHGLKLDAIDPAAAQRVRDFDKALGVPAATSPAPPATAPAPTSSPAPTSAPSSAPLTGG